MFVEFFFLGFFFFFSWLTDRFCHAPVMRNKDVNWNGLILTHSQYMSLNQNCLQTVSGQTLFSSLNDAVISHHFKVGVLFDFFADSPPLFFKWNSPYKQSSFNGMYCECVEAHGADICFILDFWFWFFQSFDSPQGPRHQLHIWRM